MDRNVAGDSDSMSEAMRLQKSRLTKRANLYKTSPLRETRAKALEQVNEHQRAEDESSENLALVLVHVNKTGRVCFCLHSCK